MRQTEEAAEGLFMHLCLLHGVSSSLVLCLLSPGMWQLISVMLNGSYKACPSMRQGKSDLFQEAPGKVGGWK